MAFELPVNDPCPFCLYVAREVTAAAGTGVLVLEDELAFSFVNPMARQLGHLLVVPKRHAPTILDVSEQEVMAVIRIVRRLARALTDEFAPAGMNIFQNNGINGGQTVAHYHIHVVPRYPDDGGTFGDGRPVALDDRRDLARRLQERLSEQLP